MNNMNDLGSDLELSLGSSLLVDIEGQRGKLRRDRGQVVHYLRYEIVLFEYVMRTVEK